VSTVRTHPGTWYEPAFNPFIQSLHLVCVILVLMGLVFDVHEDVYNFHTEKPFYGQESYNKLE